MKVARKKGSKLGKKILTEFNHKVLKSKVMQKVPGTQKLSKKLCKMGFEPVDLIGGVVVYEAWTSICLPLYHSHGSARGTPTPYIPAGWDTGYTVSMTVACRNFPNWGLPPYVWKTDVPWHSR